MKRVVLLICAALLTGCAAIPEGSTKDEMNRAAGVSLTIIKELWIPALNQYSTLPRCDAPSAPPCLNVNIYRKLYTATGTVVLCMYAATREELTPLGFAACKARYDETYAMFTKELQVEHVDQ